mmetsp:Transcript_101154/g.292522  ORF Transcript_101154/g.292522 Transcript_101154/m.292522 type:complete len:416 (-) Transcript_101154:171-1418(-)
MSCGAMRGGPVHGPREKNASENDGAGALVPRNRLLGQRHVGPSPGSPSSRPPSWPTPPPEPRRVLVRYVPRSPSVNTMPPAWAAVRLRKVSDRRALPPPPAKQDLAAAAAVDHSSPSAPTGGARAHRARGNLLGSGVDRASFRQYIAFAAGIATAGTGTKLGPGVSRVAAGVRGTRLLEAVLPPRGRDTLRARARLLLEVARGSWWGAGDTPAIEKVEVQAGEPVEQEEPEAELEVSLIPTTVATTASESPMTAASMATSTTTDRCAIVSLVPMEPSGTWEVSAPVAATAAGALGAAMAFGAAGGTAGLATGSAVGAVIGLAPALVTFGLSIPIGAAIGGGTGLLAGAAAGSAVGAVGGGAAGFGAYSHREQLAEAAVWAMAKVSKVKLVHDAATQSGILQLSFRGNGVGAFEDA